MRFLLHMLSNYGYIVLTSALFLELIALPLPGELLMTYCGFLVSKGNLNWGLSIIFASLGSILGITVAYLLGKILGHTFFKKYGSYIHLGPERLDKVSKWFSRYGEKVLIIAYFIPGVRHLSGYFSGIAEIKYKDFAINAYIGALLWTTIFITMGKFVGDKWNRYHRLIMKISFFASIGILCVMIVVYFYRKYKKEFYEYIFKLLGRSIKIFHSRRRTRVVLLSLAVMLVMLSVSMEAIIHAFLHRQSREFNELNKIIIQHAFDKDWLYAMKHIQNLSSYAALFVIFLATIIWVILKNRDYLLEIKIIVFTDIGAFVFEKILRCIFHQQGPLGMALNKAIIYTFPSGDVLLSVVVYGFLAYVIAIHSNRIKIKTMAITAAAIISVMLGLSTIYLNFAYPNDVIAAYIFGSVWLILNIILLEVFRVLPTINSEK